MEPFFAHVLSGLQSRLSNEGIATQLLIVEDVRAEMEVYRRWAAENRVGGLVLLDLEVDDPRPDLIAELRVPAVVLGGHGVDLPLTSVWADDYGGRRPARHHLLRARPHPQIPSDRQSRDHRPLRGQPPAARLRRGRRNQETATRAERDSPDHS